MSFFWQQWGGSVTAYVLARHALIAQCIKHECRMPAGLILSRCKLFYVLQRAIRICSSEGVYMGVWYLWERFFLKANFEGFSWKQLWFCLYDRKSSCYSHAMCFKAPCTSFFFLGVTSSLGQNLLVSLVFLRVFFGNNHFACVNRVILNVASENTVQVAG